MPTCIYCKGDSSESTSVPHVIPELLTENELTLPIGAECDDCNAYAGHSLEPELGRHPEIAFAIQYLGSPGKKGKVRAEMGGVRRSPADGRQFRLSLKGRGRARIDEAGHFRMEGHVHPVPSFDFLRFRRALHHIGLNFVAAAQGVDVALGPPFDSVRRYVRRPRSRKESWAFGHWRLNDFPRVVGVGPVEYDGTELIQVRAFQSVFLIDLMESGRLEEATLALGGTFVGSDVQAPAPVSISLGGKPAVR